MAPDLAEAGSIADIVRLSSYPLDRLESPEGKALIERCLAMLAVDGACLLSGFLTEEALAQATADIGLPQCTAAQILRLTP